VYQKEKEEIPQRTARSQNNKSKKKKMQIIGRSLSHSTPLTLAIIINSTQHILQRC
jgi:hypothetical protein